ncbi:MAG TPA: oxygen-independent coproporphyrinogen III oxidase [Reyranella sp.]|nr:oxygen-independent coproporphyrinogen III oxidase [Reyranella sp.]
MDPDILAAYDRPVPRYTSYPTAAQFDKAVGPAQHADWLRDLNGQAACLYVHVPFCRELCWYCACNTMAMNRPGTLDSYADALDAELLRVARIAPGMILDGIQWGGGTPSQLGPVRLRRVGRRIAALFDQRADAENSLEIDPRQCNGPLAEAIAEIGVTRVSLGVQDFDPAVQKAINRRQSFETTARAIGLLRGEGIRRFNLDLVYGLPHQTMASLERTLDLALELAPSRFAVFGYAHVPWMKPHQKLIDAAALPDASLRAEMAERVAGRLVAAGYMRVGLDHFARPDDALALAARSGGLKRNFQGYVADDSPWLVGIGASAISSLPRGFTQNTADPGWYIAAVANGPFATARGVALTDDDRLRASIIEHLMCEGGVDLREQCRRFKVDTEAFVTTVDALPSLARDGLVALEDGMVRITEEGRPLVRFVCAAFDRHYTGQPGRHSQGI